MIEAIIAIVAFLIISQAVGFCILGLIQMFQERRQPIPDYKPPPKWEDLPWQDRWHPTAEGRERIKQEWMRKNHLCPDQRRYS